MADKLQTDNGRFRDGATGGSIMNGNEHKGEEKRLKKCPFLQEYCTEGRCVLFTDMVRDVGGLQQKFGLCSFNAMVMMLSEMNQKTQPPQQKILHRA